MIRKGIALIVMLLFIGLVIIPSSGILIKNSESLETNKEIEILVNSPPKIPSNPIPENGEVDVPINGIFLNWDGEPLRNDVYLGKNYPPPLVAENLSATQYEPGLMNKYTIYYWQIVAKDYSGAKTPGPIWNFTTGSRINRPPNAPGITAEKITDNIFLIKFELTDPDGDNLTAFAVQWDKNQFGFLYKGNWTNGTIIEEIKGYGRGRHRITASCLDRWSKWGDDGYLEITIPKSKNVYFGWLERFPILQRLLNILENIKK